MRTKSFLLVLCIVLCQVVDFAHSHRRHRHRGPHHRHGTSHHSHSSGSKDRNDNSPDHKRSLGRFACLINGTEVIQKTCGCNNETVPCSVGPLNLAGKDGNIVQATFCDVPNNWTSPEPWRGVFKGACRIESENGTIIKNRSCHNNAECGSDSTNYISTAVNGNEAKVYFCDDQLNYQGDCPKKEKRDCVPLKRSKPDDKHRPGFWPGHPRPSLGRQPDLGHRRPGLGHRQPDLGHRRPGFGHRRPDSGRRGSSHRRGRGHNKPWYKPRDKRRRGEDKPWFGGRFQPLRDWPTWSQSGLFRDWPQRNKRNGQNVNTGDP